MNEKFFEIIDMIREERPQQALRDQLMNLHENDIADLIRLLTRQERSRIYNLLGMEKTAEVFSYFHEPGRYFDELTLDSAARVISLMEPDDAVDVLEGLEPQKKHQILSRLDPATVKDVRLLLSYPQDEMGSYMTINYVSIQEGLSIRQAMSALVSQAGTHDNITTIYVTDGESRLTGAIDLKDLITAREGDNLQNIIVRGYPHVLDHDKISDCISKIRDYAEDSIPVLSQEGRILGVITAEDLVEMVDEEMGQDYARLAGLPDEADLEEPTLTSLRKRLPWLIVLLGLGMLVSSVVGVFEGVVAALPIVICFQSLVLDMAGNVGTQSLAVTIRVLMDEHITGSQKLGLLWKETRVGLLSGGFLGLLALLFLGLYVHFTSGSPWAAAFSVSGCVGIALVAAMVVSSMVGTLVPMFFHRIKIDPAVASGPLITTVNDLVAVVVYYGLAYLLLIP